MPRKSQGPRLAQNKYGVWEIRWVENRVSKRQSTKETLRSKAEKALAKFLLNTAEERGVPTIANVLDKYKTEHVYPKNEAIERAEVAIAVLTKAVGKLPVNQFSIEKQRRYIQARMDGKVNGRKVQSSTIRRELNVLIAAINHARKHGRLAPTAVPYIALPEGGAPRDLWLTADEADFWLETAREVGERAHLFSAIALYAASRKRAIETLRWSTQVHLGRGLIDFNTPGRKQTKKRRPVVPIADELLPILEAAHEKRTTDYVLGHPGSVRKTMNTLAAAAVERAKKQPDRFPDWQKFAKVTPHTLRHTCATLMAQAGVSMWQIAGMLGDTLATVEKNYAHHHPDFLRDAANWRAQHRTGSQNGSQNPVDERILTRQLSTQPGLKL